MNSKSKGPVYAVPRGGERPDVWLSDIQKDDSLTRLIDYGLDLFPEFHLDYGRRNLLPVSEIPSKVFFSFKDLSERKKNDLPDVMKIQSAVILVSPRFKALLERFEMQGNLITKVDLFEYDRVTPRPDRLFMLHVREARDCLVPEQSDEIKLAFPDAPMRIIPSQQCVVAVRPPQNGIDLWTEPNLTGSVFVSDRLARAMEDEGVGFPRLWPCKTVA